MTHRTTVELHLDKMQGHTIFLVNDEQAETPHQVRPERPVHRRDLRWCQPVPLNNDINHPRVWLLGNETYLWVMADCLENADVRETDVTVRARWTDVVPRARPASTFGRLAAHQWPVPGRNIGVPYFAAKTPYPILQATLDTRLGATERMGGESGWIVEIGASEFIWRFDRQNGGMEMPTVNFFITRDTPYWVQPIYLAQHMYIDIQRWLQNWLRNGFPIAPLTRPDTTDLGQYIVSLQTGMWAVRRPPRREIPHETINAALRQKGDYKSVVKTMRGKILKDEWL